MKQQKSSAHLAGKTLAAFLFGLASAAFGILNYLFPGAVTALSIIGFAAGTGGLVFSIAVRKALPDKPPLAATLGLIMSIVGLLWNLVFFVACSSLACGGSNLF